MNAELSTFVEDLFISKAFQQHTHTNNMQY